MIIASIDIGTNTILMLIAKIENKSIKPLMQYHRIARLGQNINKTGEINQNAITRAVNILNEYKSECNKHGVQKILVTATSALRDAQNKNYVISEFQKIINDDIKIISGKTEAKLSFLGSVKNCNGNNFLIDIGGGSTEYIIANNNDVLLLESLDIGAVRITEKFFPKQPPAKNELEYSEKFIDDNLQKLNNSIEINNFFGVAGTVTTIATTHLKLGKFDENKIEGIRLSIQNINDIYLKYANSNTETIINDYHVNPKRADLITAGALILKKSMEYFNINRIIVSTKGLRFGIIQNFINNIY